VGFDGKESNVTTANSAGNPATANADCVPQAAREMILATCGVEIEDVQEGQCACDGGAMVSVISVVGDVEWSVLLGLPKETASGIAAKFAGFEIPFDSADMGDAIGELCNILVGQVKALLDQRGLDVEISLPSVMRAENPEVLVQKDCFSQRSFFTSSLGPMWTGLIAGKSPTPAA
jgi:CheY-specific phosphatase CheX